MPRKKTSLIEDVFVVLVQLPWCFGIVFAVIFWVMGDIVTGRLGPEPVTAAIAPLIKILFRILSFIALAAAGGSAFKSFSRRKLLDQQSGIDSLRNLSWHQFEQLVGEAYRRQGYDVEETGGGGADGGVDLVLRRHGEKVLVQCKRWKTFKVGVDKVRELFGVVTAENADRGVLVTSGHFTKEALAFLTGKPLELIDGPALAKLVCDIQNDNCCPSGSVTEETEQSETRCPICGSEMVLRTARQGANAGKQFYGCALYPKCRGTRQYN